MDRPLVRLALFVAAWAGALRWVWNSNEWSGPVVMQLSATHGVHLHDWVAPALVLLAAVIVFSPQWARRPVASTTRR
jgi:hypothetical protein